MDDYPTQESEDFTQLLGAGADEQAARRILGMVIDLTKLRFYVLKSEDLKGDDTTETDGCTFSPFQNADLDTYTDGDHFSTVTCRFPVNGTLPAGSDTFRLVKNGAKVRIENAAGEKLEEIDPLDKPHVLMRRDPANPTAPYANKISTFANSAALETTLKEHKRFARINYQDVPHTLGPIVPIEIGGFHLRGREINLPSVRDRLLGLDLPRDAAADFSGGGFALDAVLNYSFLKEDYAWLGTLLDSVARVGFTLRTTTLSAPDTISGIPGEDAALGYKRYGLLWRPTLSTQAIARSAKSMFYDSHYVHWDLAASYETPIIQEERFAGNVPWGGRSLAETLDVSQRLYPFSTHAFVLSLRGCVGGGEWAPCFGGVFKVQGAREFLAGGFSFDMRLEYVGQVVLSLGNAVQVETTNIGTPGTVNVTALPPPTVTPPTPPAPTIQADPPPPPPAMTPVPPPQRLALEIKGAEANFRVGSAALLPGTKQTIEGKMVHPIGDFWQKLMAQGYSPTTTLYINVGGFASSEGRFENNLRLSGNRAGSVQGYLRTRFTQLNDAAWRADKKTDPKLQRNAWTPPYPDPRNIVFQVRGYGETEPICKDTSKPCSSTNDRVADANEDKENSRRFVAGVFTDANEATTAMKPGPVSTVTATGDGQRAEAIAAMFRAAGFKAGFDTTANMLLVTLPVSWKDPKPDIKGAATLRKLASTITKAAKHFKGMSRAVSLKIGMIAEPTADETVELQRIETVKEMLYGRKQFAKWPVNGPTDIIPVPAGLSDPMAHLVQEAAKPIGSVLVDAGKATALLNATAKNVTIAGESTSLFVIPIQLDPKGNPTPAMMDMVAAIGQSMDAKDWLSASLYRHTSASFDVKNVMQKLYARLTDAHRQKHNVPNVDPNHFFMDQSKVALPDKATRLYIVVSAQEIPRPAIVEKIFKMALPYQP